MNVFLNLHLKKRTSYKVNLSSQCFLHLLRKGIQMLAISEWRLYLSALEGKH